MFIKRIALFSIIITTPIFARIIKVDTLHMMQTEIENIIAIHPQKILVIFDLDNTLIEPDNDSQYASNQWLEAHVVRSIKNGIPASLAWDTMLPIWFETQNDPAFYLRTVEKETAQIFQAIQKLTDKTIGLSSRSFYVIPSTIDHLNRLHLNFLSHSFPEGIKFATAHSQYIKGILFSGSNDKGSLLLEFLAYYDYRPDLVIFVNDKEKYLYSLEIALKKENIPFVGMHYTYLENKVKKYSLHPTVMTYNAGKN